MVNFIRTHGNRVFTAAAVVAVLTSNASADQRFRKNDEIETQLGDRLPEVADEYGMNESAFRAMIRRDRSLRADNTERLHYACEGLVSHPVKANAGTVSGTSTTAAAPYPDSQTFLLHSRPTSSRKISWTSTATPPPARPGTVPTPLVPAL